MENKILHFLFGTGNLSLRWKSLCKRLIKGNVTFVKGKGSKPCSAEGELAL